MNEKIVIDMLAVMEDGFSMVSEVNTAVQQVDSNNASMKAGVSTSNIISKFLKIQLDASVEEKQENGTSQLNKQEKVHTNVSLFSKFKTKLVENDLIISNVEDLRDISKINSGDFVEIAGVLQKNPEHYHPEDAHDVQEMLKDLLGDTMQGMLEAEMDEKLGYSKYDYQNKDTDDSRNG